MHDIFQALILGIVEGITEFLPVSSTGHMRLVEHWIGKIGSEDFSKSFDVFIQIGAIIAVVVYFRRKIAFLLGMQGADHGAIAGKGGVPTDPLPDAVVAREGVPAPLPTLGYAVPPVLNERTRTLVLLALATVPLAIGYFGAKNTEHYMTAHPGAEPLWIAAALGIGGVLMILVEMLRPKARVASMSDLSFGQAFVIGLFQILAAVFPGTSRSAATITPALALGIARPAAAEFSFFLAIPAMFGAAGVKLVHFLRTPGHSVHEALLLGIGTLTAFIVAYVVVAGFMAFIRRHTFVPFAIYRIILAAVVLLLMKG